MNWTQLTRHTWESDTGHRVSAARVREQQHRYCAWAPPKPVAEVEAAQKAHYCLGEPVPQVRELIGCYPDAEAARAACVASHVGKKGAA